MSGRLVGFEDDVHAVSVFRSEIASNIRADLDKGGERLLNDFVNEFPIAAEAVQWMSTRMRHYN